MTYNLQISIPLSGTHLSDLKSLQNTIVSTGLFLPNPNFDIGIKLNSLGRVDQSTVSQLINTTLPRVCRRLSQFELCFPFLSSLYKRKEPSPIFLDPQPTQKVVEIYESLAEVLNNLKFPQPRRFEPQLIVAFPQKSDPETTKNMLEKIDSFNYVPLSPFFVTSLQIYQVTTTKKGTHYQKLATLSLPPAAA